MRQPPGQTAANVRAELARRGRTGRDLAKALDWPYSTTARRLAGKSAFTVEQLSDVATYLDMPMAELVSTADAAA